jgi:hypothetical protein
MVKGETFNLCYMGSNPIGLKFKNYFFFSCLPAQPASQFHRQEAGWLGLPAKLAGHSTQLKK